MYLLYIYTYIYIHARRPDAERAEPYEFEERRGIIHIHTCINKLYIYSYIYI